MYGNMKIRHFIPISPYIATSGQPTEAEILEIAMQGYTIVINLALPTSSFALINEKDTVESTGMRYISIPVAFENPTKSDLLQFFAALENHKTEKIWVHCVVNMRVSAFVYLWRVLRQGVSPDDAEIELHDAWVPEKENSIWHRFILEAQTEKW
jgi:protein tyrosine phosphatase (PTP) superfamily phosphohydrolase (DUF442 family)